MKTILLVLALVLAGCASTADNFDSGFSSDQVSAVEAGFGEWPTHRPVEIVRAPGNDCPAEEPGILAWTLPGNAEYQTKICLYVDQCGSQLQRVAAHEMGHALAGNSIHTPDDGPDSIMKATLGQDALTPTSYDLSRL